MKREVKMPIMRDSGDPTYNKATGTGSGGCGKANSDVDKLASVIQIQYQEGNYKASEYMRGLCNGLLLAQAILTDKNPEYK